MSKSEAGELEGEMSFEQKGVTVLMTTRWPGEHEKEGGFEQQHGVAVAKSLSAAPQPAQNDGGEATAGETVGGGGREEEVVNVGPAGIPAECESSKFAPLDREDTADQRNGWGGGDSLFSAPMSARFRQGTTPPMAVAPGIVENAGLSFEDLERKSRNMRSR